MLMIGSNEIGGGFVRLSFSDATRRYKVGEALTAAQIKAFHNHRGMIAIGKIAVYPPPPPPPPPPAPLAESARKK